MAALCAPLLGLLLLALPARCETVDRILAVVERTLLGGPNGPGRIITWSAAYEEALYQTFQSGSEPPQWTPDQSGSTAQLDEILARMVDRLLLEEALTRSPLAPSGDQDVSERLRQIAGRFPDAESFQRELARYGMSESELVSRLQHEKLLMEFVDFTLRPDVRVAEVQIAQYYRTVLLPQLGSDAGPNDATAGSPPLEGVRDQIEEILTQQEIGLRLEQWLRQLRRGAKIVVRH